MADYRRRDAVTVSQYMSAIRAVGGRAEVALRSALHRRGLRFRKNVTSLVGRPDIVFAAARVIVFVDGDYWHARVLREAGPAALRERLQTPNRDYWMRKFQRRVEIDQHVSSSLSGMGWRVLRYWESDVRRNPDRIADEIERTVRQRADC